LSIFIQKYKDNHKYDTTCVVAERMSAVIAVTPVEIADVAAFVKGQITRAVDYNMDFIATEFAKYTALRARESDAVPAAAPDMAVRMEALAEREADMADREANMAAREAGMAARETAAAGREAALASRELDMTFREGDVAVREAALSGRKIQAAPVVIKQERGIAETIDLTEAKTDAECVTPRPAGIRITTGPVGWDVEPEADDAAEAEEETEEVDAEAEEEEEEAEAEEETEEVDAEAEEEEAEAEEETEEVDAEAEEVDAEAEEVDAEAEEEEAEAEDDAEEVTEEETEEVDAEAEEAEAEEEPEEVQVSEIVIKGKLYYTDDTESGDIYEALEDGCAGDKVGVFVAGVAKFAKRTIPAKR
jgi:hypothetical protein